MYCISRSVIHFYFFYLSTVDIPVCFYRRSCDGRNFEVKRIDCNENKNLIYRKYPDKTDFCMKDLLLCSLQVFSHFKAGLRSPAITCDFGILPDVPNARVESSTCFNNCEGDVCPVTCEENYYVKGDNTAYCTNVNNKGQWEVSNFMCEEITCPNDEKDFPPVFGGQFKKTNCSGNKVGHTCTMICATNFFTLEVKQTTCEKFDDSTGKWSSGVFSCNGKISNI
ncbi:hypothetical protein HOLleu_22201 [Holothuria leucospilota]|uniref:Sushi domain-containing protein n=1 Tax=Holothuria leucospilota TaxID=206669 RepID=A0A9Q1BZ30_HOLLE|nr:hypothetical protein HOLleu_22201 [Holothuria leucospilota]